VCCYALRDLPVARLKHGAGRSSQARGSIVVKAIGFAAAVMAAFSLCADAEIYTGTLTYPSGLDATDGSPWADPATTITYTVFENVGGETWHYKYELTAADDPAVSHFILEVSENWTQANNDQNLLNLTGGPYKEIEVGDFGTEGPSNPDIPEEIHGVKFNFDNGTHAVIEFDAPRRPVWGDFHAKGGQDYGLWNLGFTSPDTDPTMPPPPQHDPVDNHLLVPDSYIPEPASVGLLALGCLSLAVRRCRRRKR
jgi:hypothetical protein